MKISFKYLVVSFFLLIFFQQTISSQNIQTIAIQKPTAVSVDRYGNIFVADVSGKIAYFDSTGKKIYEYSPSKIARVSLLESWRSVKTFVFYQDLQAFTLLNRFLVATAEQYRFSNAIGFARLATLANDDNLWVFDEADFSLKKYNPDNEQIILNVPLSLIVENKDYNFTFMREYQNLLFISDANSGILVFDNLGNYKKKIPVSGLKHFGFSGDELYFFKDDTLYFSHLYQTTERIIKLPKTEEKINFVLYLDRKIIIFTDKSLIINR
ncbi:MAG: hypothetical protein H7Y04_04430 [Verrucomicrobia bacterium]|nr:hypothetical protein [Cytophagales bacterium]